VGGGILVVGSINMDLVVVSVPTRREVDEWLTTH